jgi:polar amino acid transport system substrate-binding protein
MKNCSLWPYLLLLSLLLLLPACGLVTPEPTPTPEPVTAAGLPDLGGQTVTVAVENTFLPFSYILRQTGQPGGWDYDAWAEICQRLNCRPVFRETPWEALLPAVSAGRLNAAGDGITITEERAKTVTFSDAYINAQIRLLARVDEDRFNNYHNFVADETLLLGAIKATTNYNYAVRLVGSERIVAVDDIVSGIEFLLNGDLDAMLLDEIGGHGYYGSNADQVEFVGPPIQTDQYGLVFTPGSDLIEPVNLALAAMRDDGSLNQLTEKYFSPAFTVTYDDIGPLGSAGQAAPGLAALPDLGGREVTIAIDLPYPPFDYIDPNTGRMTGWDYDTWADICRRLNCKPVYTLVDWGNLIAAVAAAKYDAGASGITITDERARQVDFSTGYIEIRERLLVRADENRFTDVKVLAATPSLLVGAQAGTTNLDVARRIVGQQRAISFNKIEDAIQALLAGQIDAVVVEDMTGREYVNQYIHLKLVGGPLQTDQIGFIYPRGSDLVGPVNQALAAMRADGTFKLFSERYAGLIPAGQAEYNLKGCCWHGR